MFKKIFKKIFKKSKSGPLPDRPTKKLYDRILLSMDLDTINREVVDCFSFIECHDILVEKILVSDKTLKLLRLLSDIDDLDFYNPGIDNKNRSVSLWGAKVHCCNKLKFGQILFLPNMSGCNGLTYELRGSYCTIFEDVIENFKVLENGISEYIEPQKFSSFSEIKEKSIEDYMRMTKKELLQLAKDLEIIGRSKMNKRELAEFCWKMENKK